jgi:protein-S-isoprenylcysteine O-methyltransferase Ste14
VLWVAISIHQQQNYAPPKITPDPKRTAKLIKSGIYARVRHPIYAGVLLTAFGLTLAHGHPVMWTLMTALYIFFYAKSRYEEALLLNYYGKSYADYMQTTGRFLPRFSS